MTINETMPIRKLTQKDLPTLFQIETLNHAVPWSEETFAQCLKAGYFGWVMEENKKIFGFIIVSYAAGEVHILNLCIHRDFQRKGQGRALLDFALSETHKKGAAIAYLEVRKSNTRAIRLYEKAGFIKIGERKNYYPVPTGMEDALVLAKDLGINEL